ncbi:MAG: hypothetical protein HYT42_02310 [Candidatus Sungbacteria bacterium]|nr:hypothetical protein [Candidatus Sungbacteria bacterium]
MINRVDPFRTLASSSTRRSGPLTRIGGKNENSRWEYNAPVARLPSTRSNGVHRAFAYLRRLPIAQRRIIGLATYIAIVAVIFSFEFASWRGSITLSGGDDAKALAQVQSERTKEKKSDQPIAALASPFAALRENAADALNAIKQLAANIKELPGQVSPLPNAVRAPSVELPAVTSPQFLTQNQEGAKEKGLERKPSNEPKVLTALRSEAAEPQKNPGVASLLASQTLLQNFPAISFRPPKPPTRDKSETESESELVKILRYNFGQVSQTAVDFYRYFRE